MFKGFAQWIVLVKFNMFKFWDNGSSNLKLGTLNTALDDASNYQLIFRVTCPPRNILDVRFDSFCLPLPQSDSGNFYWISSETNIISTWMILYTIFNPSPEKEIWNWFRNDVIKRWLCIENFRKFQNYFSCSSLLSRPSLLSQSPHLSVRNNSIITEPHHHHCQVLWEGVLCSTAVHTYFLN